MSDAKIEFPAELHRATTTVDYSWHITFSTSEDVTAQVASLVEAKRAGIPLRLIIVPDIQETNKNGKVSTRTEWES
jgi:hypothetical protein